MGDTAMSKPYLSPAELEYLRLMEQQWFKRVYVDRGSFVLPHIAYNLRREWFDPSAQYRCSQGALGHGDVFVEQGDWGWTISGDKVRHVREILGMTLV